MTINVTRSSMPPFEEYCEEIRELWDSHWLTNMGSKHQQLERELAAYKQMHAPVQMGVDVRTGEIAPDYRTLEQNPNAVYGTGQKTSANVTVQDTAGNARMETETGTDSQPDEVQHARNDKYAKRSKRYVKNHGN